MTWITLPLAFLIVATIPAIEAPVGTVLPVILVSRLNATKDKPGKELEGRVMQEVPLPSGVSIKEGSRIIGHVVNVTENSSGSTSVAVTFDAIQEKDRTTPMKTGLLALATMDNVHHAQLPISANSDRILSVSGPRAKLVETLCGVGSAR